MESIGYIKYDVTKALALCDAYIDGWNAMQEKSRQYHIHRVMNRRFFRARTIEQAEAMLTDDLGKKDYFVTWGYYKYLDVCKLKTTVEHAIEEKISEVFIEVGMIDTLLNTDFDKNLAPDARAFVVNK